MGLALIFVFLIKTVAAIWVNYKILFFSKQQEVRLRSFLLGSYQNLSYVNYIERNSSEYVQSIISLVGQYTNNIIVSSLRILSDGVIAFSILLFLAWSSGLELLIILIVLAILIFIYDHFFGKKAEIYGKKANKSDISMVKGVNEAMDGIKEIRIFGCEKFFHDQVSESAKSFGKSALKTQMILTSPKYLLEMIVVLFVVLIAIISTESGRNMGEILPILGVFGFAALRLLPSMASLSNSLSQIRFGKDAVFRLYNDLKVLRKETTPFKEGYKSQANIKVKSLCLKNVNFSYPGANFNALSNISLEINPGESIGIIGKSGSGKTTLMDIMLGLLQPNSGIICYGKDNLNNSIADWRSQIAYLPQSVFLVDESLKNNIALGVSDENIVEERVYSSIEQSSLAGLLKNLPNGIHTKIGDKGIKLSGGQRQRIALARAFYYRRNVLFMDEATSSLDIETENEVVEEVKKLKGEKTIVVIAHRMTTLKHCDRIYELEDGTIKKCGQYDDFI